MNPIHTSASKTQEKEQPLLVLQPKWKGLHIASLYDEMREIERFGEHVPAKRVAAVATLISTFVLGTVVFAGLAVSKGEPAYWFATLSCLAAAYVTWKAYRYTVLHPSEGDQSDALELSEEYHRLQNETGALVPLDFFERYLPLTKLLDPPRLPIHSDLSYTQFLKLREFCDDERWKEMQDFLSKTCEPQQTLHRFCCQIPKFSSDHLKESLSRIDFSDLLADPAFLEHFLCSLTDAHLRSKGILKLLTLHLPIHWGDKDFLLSIREKGEAIRSFILEFQRTRSLPNAEIKLRQAIEALFQQKRIVNCTLEIDGKSYGMNKEQLIANSGYFKRIFSHEFKETQGENPELKIEDPSDMDILCAYLSDPQFSLLNHDFSQLLHVADYFDVPTLKTQCESLLIQEAHQIFRGDFLKKAFATDQNEQRKQILSHMKYALHFDLETHFKLIYKCLLESSTSILGSRYENAVNRSTLFRDFLGEFQDSRLNQLSEEVFHEHIGILAKILSPGQVPEVWERVQLVPDSVEYHACVEKMKLVPMQVSGGFGGYPPENLLKAANRQGTSEK